MKKMMKGRNEAIQANTSEKEDVALRRWLDSFVHPVPLSKLTSTYR